MSFEFNHAANLLVFFWITKEMGVKNKKNNYYLP
jgi:hypothetical protein